MGGKTSRLLGIIAKCMEDNFSLYLLFSLDIFLRVQFVGRVLASLVRDPYSECLKYLLI